MAKALLIRANSAKAAQDIAAKYRAEGRKSVFYGHSAFMNGWLVGSKKTITDLGATDLQKPSEIDVAALKAKQSLKKAKGRGEPVY